MASDWRTEFPDQVPLTDQDIADLREAGKFMFGSENPEGTVSPFEVERRILIAHGFDPSSYYVVDGTLWGKRTQ
jgi:hypothetical protein